jgi:cell division protein FtsB
MGRLRKKEPQTELEKLQARVHWLEAENALLKKAKALMEEEESRQRGFGRRSSRH